MVLTNAKYPNRSDTKHNLQGVTIRRDAVIGANVTILPGVNIGEHAIVGAGSVVIKDVADRTVVAGNPAIPLNKISELPAEH